MIAHFPLLAGLADDALARLGLTAAPVCLPTGTALFRQGDISDGLYLIDDGDVRLVGRTPGDGQVDLARLGPGEMVGEFSLLDGGPRSATALARSDVRAWRIGIDAFAALATSGDAAALTIMDRLRVEVAERTRDTVAAITAALAAGGGTPRPPGGGMILTRQPATDAEQLLHSFPGFDRLTADEWVEIGRLSTQVLASAGTLIGDAGTATDALTIVARGAVRAGIAHPAGGIEQLLIHGPGSFSGAAAMLDGRASAFVRDVREDAVLLLIEPDAFAALRAGTSPLGGKLFAAIGLQMVRDLRRLSRVLGRLSGSNH